MMKRQAFFELVGKAKDETTWRQCRDQLVAMGPEAVQKWEKIYAQKLRENGLKPESRTDGLGEAVHSIVEKAPLLSRGIKPERDHDPMIDRTAILRMAQSLAASTNGVHAA